MELAQSGCLDMRTGKWTPLEGWTKFQKFIFFIKSLSIWCIFHHQWQRRTIKGTVIHNSPIIELFTKRDSTRQEEVVFVLERCTRCFKRSVYFEDLMNHKTFISPNFADESDWTSESFIGKK